VGCRRAVVESIMLRVNDCYRLYRVGGLYLGRERGGGKKGGEQGEGGEDVESGSSMRGWRCRNYSHVRYYGKHHRRRRSPGMAYWDMRVWTGKPKMAYWDNSRKIKELDSAGEIRRIRQWNHSIHTIAIST